MGRSLGSGVSLTLLVTLLLATPALATEAHILSFRFGWEVNETKVKEKAEGKTVSETEENICTALSGNVCKAGIEGAGPGQLKNPHSIAVNNDTGAVFVTDTGNNRVQEFNANGKFILMLGGKVNETKGTNLCTEAEVEAEGVKCKAGARAAGSGEFKEPRGIAVDNTGGAHTGDVYVADAGNNRVQVFTGGGVFIEEVKGTETPNKAFSSPRAVAVSPTTGSLYVADEGHGCVVEFEYNATEAKYKYIAGSEMKAAQTEEPEGVAVDSNGNVYVQNGKTLVVSQFNSSGVYQQALGATNALGVAVNTKTNDVYVSRSTAGLIAEYEPSGKLLLEFGAAIKGTDNFVAVSASNDDVYDAEQSSNAIDMFEPTSEVPGVTTGGTTSVTETSAILNGSIEPFGFATTYYFEYGTTEAFGEVAPATPASAGTAAKSVSEGISGLTPNTIYYYRLVGEAGFGAKFGSKASFKTLAHEPAVTTDNATSTGHTSAMLSGEINPEGALTTFSFSYVLASKCVGGLANYGGSGCATTTVPNSAGIAGEGTTPVRETASLSSLQPNTTYYFDLTASNGRATSGVAHEVKTVPLAPEAYTSGTGDVAGTTAMMYGAVNPLGAATEYHFEYGPTTSYGSESTELSAGATSGFEDLSTQATGLQPGTTYHFRIVATNDKNGAPQTTYGEDKTFTTTEAEPYPVAPTATTGGATDVFASGATLAGTVNPEGSEATYQFEYGPTAYYGAASPSAAGSASSAAEARSVSEGIVGLQPGTTYHYRLVASSAGGAAYGEDETFTTPVAPVAPVVAQPTTQLKAPAGATTEKTQTKAEKLKAALKRCKRDAKNQRASCEKQARKKYVTKKKKEKGKKKKEKGKKG